MAQRKLRFPRGMAVTYDGGNAVVLSQSVDGTEVVVEGKGLPPTVLNPKTTHMRPLDVS